MGIFSALENQVLIDLFRLSKKRKISDEFFYISFLTAAELYYGAEKSNNTAKNNNLIEHFLLSIEIIESDLEICKKFGELKSKLENLQRTLSTLNNVIEKGLKEDMGCIVFRGNEGILEIAFLKSTGNRENFSLKSIYTGNAIPIENMIKIGVQ